MAAFIDRGSSSTPKPLLGLVFHFLGLVFFIAALYLSTDASQSLEARQAGLQAGWFAGSGWLIQQWETGNCPHQRQIQALWETRWGNLFLSLLLAGALTLFSVLSVHTLLPVRPVN